MVRGRYSRLWSALVICWLIIAIFSVNIHHKVRVFLHFSPETFIFCRIKTFIYNFVWSALDSSTFWPSQAAASNKNVPMATAFARVQNRNRINPLHHHKCLLTKTFATFTFYTFNWPLSLFSLYPFSFKNYPFVLKIFINWDFL